MVDGKFTAKERAYLASLPAVESVSASHIRYADSFRIEVMCRYNAGESPAAIFREAGLDPKLIGYKRIERCIARWKKQEERDRRNSKRVDRDDLRVIRHHDLMRDDAQSSATESQDALSKLAQAQLIINQCDELIAKQALRIDELERVLRKLVGCPRDWCDHRYCDSRSGRVVGLVATQAVAYSQACCLVAEAWLIRLHLRE